MRIKNRGQYGEELACKYLLSKKYSIVSTNYYYKNYEIDIIAKKEELYIAVEVKLRSAPFIVNPFDAVGKFKQAKIIQVMNRYVQTNTINKEVRFDIISIVLYKGSYKIEHLKNAFYPSLSI